MLDGYLYVIIVKLGCIDLYIIRNFAENFREVTDSIVNGERVFNLRSQHGKYRAYFPSYWACFRRVVIVLFAPDVRFTIEERRTGDFQLLNRPATCW